MAQIVSDEQKIKSLVDYYKKDGLCIIGLNDSQGVNVTSTIFKKGLLEYLASALTTAELKPTVINAFSLLMNKTEHIDYFLESNLSLEEIKLSQTYSAVLALEKVMEDLGLPRFFCNLGNIYKLVYSPKKGDSDIQISTVLREAVEPTLIYSSGVNNLMREVGNNPFSIRRDYKNRFVNSKYEYTLSKATDPNTLCRVMGGVERNFDRILSINDNSDIYALGAYIPKSLEGEGMNVFRDLINEYNELLQELSQKYRVTYINTEAIGKTFNNSEANFHISTAGHNRLANHILGYMYERKIEKPMPKEAYRGSLYVVADDGSSGVLDSVKYDHSQRLLNATHLSGYERKRELEIVGEHAREAKVFSKVLNKMGKKQ